MSAAGKRKSLTEDVQEKLMNMIYNQEFAADGSLPSEGELSALFQVSRTTTRSAVGALVEKGLLERRHGKGVYVVDNTSTAAVESLRLFMLSDNYSLTEFLETRSILETQNAYYAALRATEEDISLLQSSVDKMRDCQNEFNEAYTLADINFHLQIAYASKNKMLIAFYEALKPLLTKIITYVVVTGGQLEADYGLHQDVLDAIAAHDPDRAYAKMLYNMKSSQATLLGELSADSSVHDIIR